jgi:hypothetical protein
MAKRRRAYRPRIVGDKVMMPADLKRLHKYMLDIEHIDHISDEMRAVVESEWPRACAQAAAEGATRIMPGRISNPKRRAPSMSMHTPDLVHVLERGTSRIRPNPLFHRRGRIEGASNRANPLAHMKGISD